MSRSSAREYALMVVYSNDVNPASDEIIPDYEESFSEKDRQFATSLVSSIPKNLDIRFPQCRIQDTINKTI